MRVALFHPDIPQNAGAILRLCACFGVPLEVIEPCGFVWSDSKLRRAGMDYIANAHLTRHATWEAFRAARPERLVLATTRGAVSAYGFDYQSDDILLFGSEGSGVTEEVHQAAGARLRIPMRPEARSLNVAMSAGMILAEALRVTGGLPQ
ncbi:MAG: tRNA (cytidine(34)-2'-O)-methyltransferase [Alphaproteobacteria bacterium]|nr:tRNA (cytidine(34)-2'-O)-methyltransferase [Alphaproteobacteria bacterium]